MSDLTLPPSSLPSFEDAPPASASDESVSKAAEDGFEHLASPYAPVLVLGPEGFVKHVTDAARRLLQYGPDQPFDDYFFTHVHGKNLHRVMRDLAAMVKRGSERASWLLRLRTGRDRWRWYRAEAINRLSLGTPAVTVRLSDLHDW
jgi:hypothetical protein